MAGIQSDFSKMQIGPWISLAFGIKNPKALVLVRPRVDFCLIAPQLRLPPLWISRQFPWWSTLSSAISRSLHVLSLLGGLTLLGAPSPIPQPPGLLMSFSIELKSGLWGTFPHLSPSWTVRELSSTQGPSLN